MEKGVRTHGSVFAARGIVKKGDRSDSRVVGARRVEQKRRRANGRVFDSLARSLVSNVEKKRSGTESGVKAAIGVAEERKPPNRCVSYAGSEAFKGISPFCRVEARIAAVRRRDYRRAWGKSPRQTSVRVTRSGGAVLFSPINGFIGIFPFVSPPGWFCDCGPEEAKNLAGKSPPPDSDPFGDTELLKNPAYLSSSKTGSYNLSSTELAVKRLA